MAEDFALGSALVVRESDLNMARDMDKAIEAIQTHADSASKSIKGFGDAVAALNSNLVPSVDNLERMAKALKDMGANKLTDVMTKTASSSEKIGGAITKAAANIDKMNESAQNDLRTWEKLQAEIVASEQRQQALNKSMKEYELTMERIKSGKGGITSPKEGQEYQANKEEYAALESHINNLRKEQQQIVANNQEYQRRKQLLADLKNYNSDSNSLENQRSADILKQMKAYYTELERSSAKSAKEAEKASKKTKAEISSTTDEHKRAEKAIRAKHREEMRTLRETEQAYRANARAYQEANNKKNATYGGAMSFAEDAMTKSINRRTQAIKYLIQARDSLSQKDSQYAQKLSILNNKIKELTKANQQAVASAKMLGGQYNSLIGIAERMAKRMFLAFSVDTVKNVMQQMVTVRANFELQQRSLEAIIQNKTKADEIFNKTVELAVKSPFKIQELVTYTKQLAAYRIESDKLYDTTKMLADVSAGLGVDMQRLILAYGQVKAAAFLRGTEVRQFTEAGVNMYGELQRYFEEEKQMKLTTAEIVDMISKRQVAFEDVERVFERLTSKGGIFFNMQEIQAETLQGKISNLADAFDVAMNKVGKSNQFIINGLVDSGKAILDNWEKVAHTLVLVASMFAAVKIQAIAASSASLKAMKAFFAADKAEKMAKTLKAMKTALSGFAIFAAIEVLDTIISKTHAYNEAMTKANENFIHQTALVREYREEYNKAVGLYNKNLNISLDEKSTEEQIKKAEANVEKYKRDMRMAVKKLVENMNKEGYEIKIDVDMIPLNELTKTFVSIRTEYQQFLDDMLRMQKNAAENEKWSGWYTLSDSIDEDAQDYTNTILQLLANQRELSIATENLGNNYNKLNAAQRKHYDAIKSGKRAKETDAQYAIRLSQAYINVANAADQGTKSLINFNLASTLKKNINTNIADIKEFDNELNNLFANIDKNDKTKIKSLIDRHAAEKEWSSYAKEFAYRKFNVPIEIDKDKSQKDADKKANWLDDYLVDFFSKKKYVLNYSFRAEDDKSLQELIDEGDDNAKQARRYKDLGERLANMVKEGAESVKFSLVGSVLKDSYPTALADDLIPIQEVITKVNNLMEDYTNRAKGLGIDPFEKKKGRKKAEVDYLSLQIEALEKMQKRWQELVKYIGKSDAGEIVKKQFKATLEYVKMPKDIIASYIPQTKEALADAIDKIIPKIKDVKKKAEAMLKVQQLRIEIKQEEFKKSLQEAKDMAEKYLSEFELNIKLKDLGFDEAQIFDLFGNLETDLDNIKDKMKTMFETSYGKSKDLWDADQTNEFLKAYEDTIKKIDKKRTDNDMKVFEELTKSYKSQMEGQLKIDVWYANERKKILENSQLKKNDNLRNSYLFNLENEYKKRTEQNKWDMFKDSSYYTFVFDNLEQQSTAMLQRMLNNLQQLRSSLKTLDPSELKVIIDQENKIQDMIAGRNPFKTLISGMKEYIKLAKDRKGLEDKLAQSEVNKMLQSRYVSELNEQYQLALKNYKVAKDTYGANSEQAKKARKNVDAKHEELQVALNLLVTHKRISKELADQLSEILGLKKEVQTAAKTIVSYANASTSAIESVFYAIGNNENALTKDIFDTLHAAGSLAESIASGDIVGMITNGGAFLAQMLTTLSGDNVAQERIEKMQKQVEQLDRSYQRLKKTFEDAWDTKGLVEYKNRTIANLKAQVQLYRNMIETEKDKKKTDYDQIRQWENTIEETMDAVKEMEESLIEQMGGLGSQSNFKSAAQDFADAWVDAFNESADSLAALEETFDGYFDNLIKKQVMNMASKKYLKKVFDYLDEIVSEGSAGGGGGTEVTAQELRKLQQIKDEQLPLFDNFVKNVLDVLGVNGKTKSSLSALQQGIQSVTESTAQALESLLNSIRFYVAQQSTDVADIRMVVVNSLGTSTRDSTIMRELESQTDTLKSIYSLLDSVTTTVANRGRCLKTYN